MATNDFLPFATGAGANVLDQADYISLSARLSGFLAGVAKSNEANKAIRQGAFIASVVAQFIADTTGQDVLDNGDASTLQTNLQAAIAAIPSIGVTALTGLANANITLTAAQAKNGIITLAGTLTGSIQIIFPATKQQWLVVNNTTGNFSVTCKTASGTGAVISQGGVAILYGDGTNLLLGTPRGARTKITTFLNPGTFPFTSSGYSYVKFRQWGAGGGGGGGGNPSAGNGGGSGSYGEIWVAMTPGQTISITNGAGGTPGPTTGGGTAGGNGGTSSVGALMSCPGGSAGAGGGTGGGSGGAAPTGAQLGYGGNPGTGPSVSVSTTQFGPPGGNAPFGAGGVTGYAGIQTNGRSPGNGGHGGVGSSTGAQTSGGAGGDGQTIVEEYIYA
ncbi:hypothetical protein [Bordetella genomosp. 9]|uniref:glycine-rich domain-containing protein n=1 Tax=Bordetella genomosp. 9 TaxID=1416803 RepID=UPI0012FB0000|nr:hypothetical protein [Bordetella genomosp. 9]